MKRAAGRYGVKQELFLAAPPRRPGLCEAPAGGQCGLATFFHTFANTQEALDNG